MIIKSLRNVFRVRFFKTKKEKTYVLRALRSKNIWPLFVYLCYRVHLYKFFTVKRAYYTLPLQKAPYSFWLYFHPKTERSEEEFIHSYVSPGDTVVDCGSHLGTVLLSAIHGCKGSGRFYAFEAHPETYLLAKENLALYKGLVSIQNKAVGEGEGCVKISSSYVSDMNHVGDHRDNYFEVEMVRLEKELESCLRINILKLDVEGQELPAIKGLGKKTKDVEAIIFESSPSSFARYGYTVKDCISYLELKGFTVYKIIDPKKMVLEKVRKDHHTKVRYEDLIALSAHGKIRLQKKGGRVQPS